MASRLSLSIHPLPLLGTGTSFFFWNTPALIPSSTLLTFSHGVCEYDTVGLRICLGWSGWFLCPSTTGGGKSDLFTFCRGLRNHSNESPCLASAHTPSRAMAPSQQEPSFAMPLDFVCYVWAPVSCDWVGACEQRGLQGRKRQKHNTEAAGEHILGTRFSCVLLPNATKQDHMT